MTRMRAPIEFVLVSVAIAVLCWMSVAVSGEEAGSGESATAASPGVECVERLRGVRRPPKRLAPGPRPRGKGYSKEEERTATSGLRMKAVCPPGKVPLTRIPPTKVQKGNPLLAPDPSGEILKLEGPARAEFIRRHVRSFEEVYKRGRGEEGAMAPPPGPPPTPPACDGVAWFGSCYYYGSAAFSTAADGGGMTQSIEKPQYVDTGGEGHSLDELAVQGGDKNGNIVEIGWFVSTEQYGNANPHIFVFHWKNWAQTCYDDCGWVQWSSTYYPGMDLGSAVGKKVYIGYVYYQGNWWAWFDNQWMGYFPGSEWDGKYTKTSLIQWFGEVASANGIPPKTDMGNGQLPTSANAASMRTLCDVDATAWVCWYRDQQSLSRTVPKYYDISRIAFGATSYGGPGE